MVEPPADEPGWRRNPGRELTQDERASPVIGDILYENGQIVRGVRLGGYRWRRNDPKFPSTSCDIAYSRRIKA